MNENLWFKIEIQKTVPMIQDLINNHARLLSCGNGKIVIPYL